MKVKRNFSSVSYLFFILIVFSFNFSNTVYGAQGNRRHGEEINYYQELGHMLGYFGYDNDDYVYCSQLLDITSEKENKKAMLVFDDDDVIGLISGTNVEGEMIYSFIYQDFDELSENVEEGNKIALVQNEDQWLSVCDNEVEVLTGNEEVIQKNIEEYQDVEGEVIEKKEIPKDITFEVSEQYDINEEERERIDEANSATKQCENVIKSVQSGLAKSRYHTLFYLLAVPFIKNENNPSNIKKGLCWAASGAMLSKYYNKGNYSALSLYKSLKSRYKQEPIGNKLWYTRMFTMLHLRTITYSRKLSYNEVVNALKKGMPIRVSFERYIKGKSEYSHSVVLCGTFYYVVDSKYYYVYRDPNVNGYVLNSIIPSTLSTNSGTTFYYVIGGDEYNNWYMTHIVYE